MAGLKKENEYNQMVTNGLYDRTPKAVFAALVVSEYINRLGVEPDEINNAILAEWGQLHRSGIVPQAPPNNSL